MALDSNDAPGNNRGMRPASPPQEPSLVLLEDIGLLRFEGPDVIGFLQGYLTSDATELGEEPKFTAMCNIRGRAVCTGFAWREGQAVTLALHRSLCAPVRDFLRPYLLFSKTRLSDETPAALVLGALGDVGDAIAGLPSPARRLDDARQLCVLPGDAPVEADAGTEAARVRWDLARIERREVWLTEETTGRFLPQMIGLDEIGAVSFSKGCYLGQEVVARAQHLGEVKRRLAALNWSGARPAPGAEVESNGRRVGTVVAAAGADAGRALAVLRAGDSGPFSAARPDTEFELAE